MLCLESHQQFSIALSLSMENWVPWREKELLADGIALSASGVWIASERTWKPLRRSDQGSSMIAFEF